MTTYRTSNQEIANFCLSKINQSYTSDIPSIEQPIVVAINRLKNGEITITQLRYDYIGAAINNLVFGEYGSSTANKLHDIQNYLDYQMNLPVNNSQQSQPQTQCATHSQIDTQLQNLSSTPYNPTLNGVSKTGGDLYELANNDTSNNNLTFGYGIDTILYEPYRHRTQTEPAYVADYYSTTKKAYIFDTTPVSNIANNNYQSLNTFIDGVSNEFNRINSIDESLNCDVSNNYYKNTTIDPIEQNTSIYNTSYGNYAAQIKRQEQLQNQLQAMQNENTLFTNAYTDISSNMAIASNYSGITDICGTIFNNKNIANDLQTQINSYNKNILSLKDRLSNIKGDLSRNYINNVVNNQASNAILKSDVSPTSLYNRLILQNDFLNKSKGDIKNDFTTENAKFLYEIDLYDRFKIINTILMIVYYLVVLRVFYITVYINNNLSNTFIIICFLFFSLYPFVIQKVETKLIHWLKYFYAIIVGNAYLQK